MKELPQEAAEGAAMQGLHLNIIDAWTENARLERGSHCPAPTGWNQGAALIKGKHGGSGGISDGQTGPPEPIKEVV